VATIYSGSSRFRFGVFEVDVHAGELRQQGIKINLQEQPFQVLALLLECPGEVVTREELQRRLWSDDTFVDFDRSLNKAINRLREALEDAADSPRFIETLPKRGYRFIAPVEPLRTASSGAAEIADSTALRLSHALRSSLLPPPKHSFLPSHFAISPDGPRVPITEQEVDPEPFLALSGFSVSETGTIFSIDRRLREASDLVRSLGPRARCHSR
jgi:DNA-binding winged helix-turn-helix (wHTH) protein